MRGALGVAGSILVLMMQSTATALTFNATLRTESGLPLNIDMFGERVFIDVRISNPSGDLIYGIGAGVQGWDSHVFQFEYAELNLGPYLCTNAACSVGLVNSVIYPNSDPDTGNYFASPADVQSIPGVGNYLPLVQAISTVGRSGNGDRDPGLDGVVGGFDAQFRLVFRFYGLGFSRIEIGTNPNPHVGNLVVRAGGVTEQAQNATVGFFPIPEPSTLVFLGAGLAGLAVRSRAAPAGRRRDTERRAPSDESLEERRNTGDGRSDGLWLPGGTTRRDASGSGAGIGAI